MIKRFIRHPADIPIGVKGHGHLAHNTHYAFNLSIRGLAFRCDREFARDDVVEIQITFVRPPFEVEARVIWCKARKEHFELGVEFLNEDDAFMARMVEQVCHIETYKKTIYSTEGRLLSPEDAAMEWISKFASGFPGS
jgi:PilZ domain